jgi:RNA:NAD 2''-phosphotransferase
MVDAPDIRELLKPRQADLPVTPEATVYHATPASNLESILGTGLEPRAENRQDVFPPRVYVTLSEFGGEEIARQLRRALIASGARKRGWREDYVLLAIDTGMIPGHVFRLDGYFVGGAYTDRFIPPDAIRLRSTLSFHARHRMTVERAPDAPPHRWFG